MFKWLKSLFGWNKDAAKNQMLNDGMRSGKALIGRIDSDGNLWYDLGITGNREIVPVCENDKNFLEMCQDTLVNGLVLPSGLQVPDQRDKCWVVQNDRIVQLTLEEYEDTLHIAMG